MAGLARDISEVVAQAGLPPVTRPGALRVAYHAACSLQHGQRIREAPRALLAQAGFEVCEAVRADPSIAGTRILMLSAKARPTDMARGLGAGADAYVTKPFATAELLERIRGLLT